MKTTRQRADEKRQEKLDLVQEQVDNGSLVIRQMTDEERQRFPARSTDAKRGRPSAARTSSGGSPPAERR